MQCVHLVLLNVMLASPMLYSGQGKTSPHKNSTHLEHSKSNEPGRFSSDERNYPYPVHARHVRHTKRRQMAPEFKKALAFGDSKMVAQYLATGDALLSVDEFGNTPLMIALGAHELSAHSINQLVKAMPDSHFAVVNDDQQNLLHIVAASEDPQAPAIIQLLIHKRVPVNARDESGLMPLNSVYSADVANVLLQNGANVENIDENGESVFSAASTYATHAGIKCLQCGKGHKPYTQQDKEALLRVLLQAGADINYKPYGSGQTPLQYALLMQDIPLITFLLEHVVTVGADTTPFVKQILAKLTQPLAKDATPEQQTAYAEFKKAAYDMLDVFAQRDPQYKAERKKIEQNLVSVTQSKDIKAMVAEYELGPTDERKKVLNSLKGIIRDSVSNDVDKIRQADAEFARLINDDPDYLKLADDMGYTPLHMAVYANALDVLNLMLAVALQQGPDFFDTLLKAQTINGKTPLELAHHLEYKEIIHALETAKKDSLKGFRPPGLASMIIAPKEPSEDDKAGISGLLE